jgi:hypothetical protein
MGQFPIYAAASAAELLLLLRWSSGVFERIGRACTCFNLVVLEPTVLQL